MGPGKVGRIGALVAVGAATMLTAAPVHATTFFDFSIPGHYLPHYNQRAKKCSDLSRFSPGTGVWVNWLSYANATVSDEWVITASSKTLCDTARKTSHTVIQDQVAGDDGASFTNLTDMINYAYRRLPWIFRAPKPAGRSWHCELLPSFWGESARTLGHDVVNDQTLAAASGAAAAAGFCAKRTNGSVAFFTWAPDTTTCKIHYRLKEVPDPNFPGSTKPISAFPTQLWSPDYDEIPC
jgi:hypothetical protein